MNVITQIMSYFVEYPKYLHKPQFSVCEYLHVYLFMIKTKTCKSIFLTQINIKFEKPYFFSRRPIRIEYIVGKILHSVERASCNDSW
jgi:hypothetical protein